MVFIFSAFLTAVLAMFWQYYYTVSYADTDCFVLNQFNLKKLKAVSWGVAAFLPVYLVYSLQSAMHSDYTNYFISYTQIRGGRTGIWEPAVELIFRAIGSANLPFHFVLLTIYALAFLVLGKCIRDYSANFSASMLLFLSVFFTLGFLQIRQLVSVLISFYAYRYIHKRQFLMFIFLVSLAICFHYSAIIMIPLYWILIIRFRFSVYCILFAFFSAFNLFQTELIIWITKTFMPQYLGRHEMFRNISIGKTDALIQIIILAVVLIYYKKAAHPGSLNWIFANAFFLQFIVFFTFRWLPEIDRFSYYIFIPVIAMVPNFIASDENRNQNMLLQFTVPILIYMLFVFGRRTHEMFFNYISIFQ